MQLLNQNTVMADLLCEHNELIPVLNRFGIKLGVGESTIEDLCNENDINSSLLLAVLNLYIDKEYIPTQLDQIDTETIVDYFHHTAENYIYELIPNIEKHLNAFIAISGSENGSESVNEELITLKTVFTKFKDKMSEYLKSLINYDEDFPDELLYDLKNILIKHVSKDFNQNLCYAVIFSIHSFEKDMSAHNRLRSRVLSPKLNLLDSSGIRELQDTITHDHTSRPEIDDHHLTNRELEILKLIVKGYINKEIADMLNISLNTVLTHRKNIIGKTGIKTVSGLTFYSLRKGLITI